MQPTLFDSKDAIKEPLYVITTIFNPIRYSARIRHYQNFEKHVLDAGANLVLIEATIGNRPPVFTEPASDRHQIVHVRVKDEIWLKENLINIAMKHLPTDWKYVAWVDADILFCRPDWVQETLQQLQHYPLVQMFSQISNLSPDNETTSSGPSFVASWYKVMSKDPQKKNVPDTYMEGLLTKLEWLGAPGGAWAARRETIDAMGGLIDFVIMGSADYYMAICLLGFLEVATAANYNAEYIRELEIWQANALKYINRNIGMVKGTILHYWHGKFKDRGYDLRWKILIDHDFNPRTDIKKDSNGVYFLTGEKWKLRDELRQYFRQRNADSIDI